MKQNQKWIKCPNPGQFRGEGDWLKLEESGYSLEEYNHMKSSKFLPTFEGKEPPKS